MDHHTPASVTSTPTTSTTRTTSKPASFLERHVGEMVAGAAGNLALALSEYQDRGVTGGTRLAGGNAIWQLYRLRQSLITDFNFNFDRVAKEHGRAVMRECCGSDVTDETVDMLVDTTLEILRRVVRDQLN